MTYLEKEEAHIVTDSDRAELQSHFPYAGIHLNELSVQEERLLLFHLRGMSKGPRAVLRGTRTWTVSSIFNNKNANALQYLRNEMREEVKFDRTGHLYGPEAKTATSTEEKNVVDSLCKLHGLFMPDSATQININVDKVEQLEKLSDAELLKLAGVDKHYLEPGDAD